MQMIEASIPAQTGSPFSAIEGFQTAILATGFTRSCVDRKAVLSDRITSGIPLCKPR